MMPTLTSKRFLTETVELFWCELGDEKEGLESSSCEQQYEIRRTAAAP
jgi:hypothetical protein